MNQLQSVYKKLQDDRLKLKGWKKINHANTNIRQSRLKARKITEDKVIYYLMIKGSIHQENIKIPNSTQVTTSKYMMKKLTGQKGETQINNIVGDFNTQKNGQN